MGPEERFTSKVKDGKVCLSLVLLPLQDLQYAFFIIIQSIFSNLSNEFSIIGFVWLIQVRAVSKYHKIFLNFPLSLFSPTFLFFDRSSQSLRSFYLCWWHAAITVTHKYSLTCRFTFKAPNICHIVRDKKMVFCRLPNLDFHGYVCALSRIFFSFSLFGVLNCQVCSVDWERVLKCNAVSLIGIFAKFITSYASPPHSCYYNHLSKRAFVSFEISFCFFRD